MVLFGHGRTDHPIAAGQLMVTRDPGLGQPYRGVVELRSGGIAEDLAYYLTESEQTPAAVVLGITAGATGILESGGLLVQLLPGVSEHEALILTERVRELDSLPDQLVFGSGPDEWLQALFGGDFEEVDRTAVEFRCGCSVDRVETAVKLLGEEEIVALLDEAAGDPVVLTCGFCRSAYALSRQRVAALLTEVRAERTAGRDPTGEPLN